MLLCFPAGKHIGITMNHSTVKELPNLERPYEKCLKFGPESLSDAELLAVILRTGTKGLTSVELAKEILKKSKKHAGLLGLHHLTVQELCGIKGVGTVKAVQIRCITELSRRMAKAAAGDGISFRSAAAIAEYYMEDFRHLEQEQVLLLMFDTRCRLLGEKVISRGTVNQSLLSPREIYLCALNYHAVGIILLHNHPSGDATPSGEDFKITQRMKDSGELLGIELLDHIVIGDRCYFSFRETGSM